MLGSTALRRPASTLADLEELGAMRSALVDWYDVNHRQLPWRVNRHSRRAGVAGGAQTSSWTAAAVDTPAPAGLSSCDFAYGVLVSEVMLQQTQVARVQSFFINWMHRWPTLAHLANATEEEVHASWAGLGYYRRARFLREGARYAVEHTGGQLPQTADALLKVPGIGPYTAASVSSIAFGQQRAAVDGNVIRVLSRIYAHLQAEPAKAAAVREMQAAADALLLPGRPGDWNQAMMELGATVCTPRAPRCGDCPLAAWCRASALQRGEGLPTDAPRPSVTDYPARPAKAAKREERVSVRVVEWHHSGEAPLFLLIRRPADGLLANLWEFPSAVSASDSDDDATQAQLDALLRSVGCPEDAVRRDLGAVEHVFSHVRWKLQAQHAVLQRDAPPQPLCSPAGALQAWRWVGGGAVSELSSSCQKLYRLLHPAPPKKRGREATATTAA